MQFTVKRETQEAKEFKKAVWTGRKQIIHLFNCTLINSGQSRYLEKFVSIGKAKMLKGNPCSFLASVVTCLSNFPFNKKLGH